jgi:hypothetical protein
MRFGAAFKHVVHNNHFVLQPKMTKPKFESSRSLTVVVKPATDLRVSKSGLASATGFNVSSIESAVAASTCSFSPMFGNEDRVIAKVRDFNAWCSSAKDIET